MRNCTSLALQRLMYNLRSTGKMMIKCSLSTGNINKIDPCTAGIETYLPIIVIHLRHFNASKRFLYIKNSAASQQIILNKSVIS